MTIVEGQIEPLTRLKEVLKANGISRFNSIADINRFNSTYEREISRIPIITKLELEEEIQELQFDLVMHKKDYDELNEKIFIGINNEINNREEKIRKTIEISNKNLISKIFLYPKIRMLINSQSRALKGLDRRIRKKTLSSKNKIIQTKHVIEILTENKESILKERIYKSHQKIKETKLIVDSLYPLIAGAIGENSVINELKKLPNDYYLINDFSMNFNPPIINKKENDKIFSIQIDHLLIAPSGIYILETKNWSKRSIDSLDLRSPVQQILRTSYALFVVLNSDSPGNRFKLNEHHWGRKKIPIRNILVMTNKSPNQEFQHVKILTLNKLNGYLKYFEPVFSREETENIFNNLK